MPADAEAEVLIVGGGPAGLATAIELRRRQIDVLVVDRDRPPIDKACGEGLMPDGVERLIALGIDVGSLESATLTGIRYLDGARRAEARFVGRPGLGIRRPILHRALVEAAERAGARLVWGTGVQSLAESAIPAGGSPNDRPAGVTARTDEGLIDARWAVGADGLHSRVRRWMGLESQRRRWQRFGVRRHYAMAPWTDRVEVYWSHRAEAYVTPVASDRVGIALLWSDDKADFDGLLARFPALAARLRGAAPASRDRGAALLEQRTRAVYRGRVALVGDAAGYRDAITGEGLSLAFHEANALADAIERGELAAYGRAAARLTRLPFLLIRLLLESERRPWLRRRLIRTLAAEPALFHQLLAVHTRDAPPREIGPAGVLRLAKGLLG